VDADAIVDPTLVILNNNLYIILIDKDMKPLNLDNRPCSPISSNCVIWQGPDIPCIKLCAGDSVSDVVFKLATELCTIMDQLNVTNYDLSCLGINSCPPEDFHALIQLLINKICEANGITVTEGKALGCPDCVVSVAPCFVEGTNPPIVAMQLIDYVQMIADRVCSILSQIDAINNELIVINDTLTDLQFQIDNLPVYTLPEIPADCILPAGDYPLDQVLNALMNDNILGYCSLLSAVGTPAQIVSGVLSQCILDGDPSLASLAAGDSPVQSFSTYYAGSWVNNPSLTTYPTVANAIKNIWIAICDMYTYLSSLALTVEDTNSIDLTYTGGVLSANVVDTGWVNLLNFSELSGGYYANNATTNSLIPQCRRIGNVVYFRGRLVVPLASSVGGPPLPYSISTTTNTYIANTTKVPSQTGTGSVFLNSPGSVVFNGNANIIPSSVVGLGQNFDNSYISKYTVGDRLIAVDDSSTILTTVGNIIITADKKLLIQLVKDVEDTAVTGFTGMQGISTSPLNYLISHVRSGDFLPDFASASTNINSGIFASGSGVTPVEIDFKTAPYTYPFSCDANQQDQIGGFSFILDGLIAYLDPCNTDIKSYICNDIGPVG
jgi:hypothetical protein